MAVSQVLGWPSDHWASTAEGQGLNDPDVGDPVLVELDATGDALTGITSRLDTIGPWLAEGCG